MQPPPPPSTLFPYTTLFRSDELMMRVSGYYNRTTKVMISVLALCMVAGLNVDTIVIVKSLKTDATVRQTMTGDRKSTRQNSSHVAISYAVFCLKKKKTDATG